MISVKNIYWMLAYAFRNINYKELQKMNAESFDNIYDLFCVMLTQGINKQIKRGLSKEYVEKEELIPVVKGRILISETLKRNASNNRKLVCEFDEYSENNYLNRIIKTASYYIIKSGKVIDQEKQANLKKSLLYFKDVDLLEVKTIQWNRIKYNRNNSSYKFLVNVSKFILEGLLINKENGKFEFLDFVDDQELYHLYEKFILEYFRYHYPELGASSPQIKWNVEEETFIEYLPKMQTDIVLKYKDKTLIIDAKYYTRSLQERYDKETYRSGNIYQIFTYVKNEDYKNTGNVSGMLLYAKTDKEDLGWEEMKMTNNIIIVTDLDLSTDFSVVQDKMKYIAEWIKK